MPYSELPAAPALRSLVACYWRMTGPADEQRVLPDGCIDILLTGEGARAEVVGTMTRAIVAPPSARGVVGIRFRPGEAARVLPAAARELTDRDALLSHAWADDAGSVEDLLAAALDAGEDLARSAARIDDALTRRLARSAEPVDLRIRAAAKLLEQGASVRDRAQAADGLADRRSAEAFGERVVRERAEPGEQERTGALLGDQRFPVLSQRSHRAEDADEDAADHSASGTDDEAEDVVDDRAQCGVVPSGNTPVDAVRSRRRRC